jgi:integrase
VQRSDRGPVESYETAAFTAEDFTKLLEQLDEPYRTMARLIALTRLRIGELLAVRWRCLDLEVGTVADGDEEHFPPSIAVR